MNATEAESAVPRGRPQRVAVLMPTWLGDCVMATPTLRRLHEGLPDAEVVALVRPGFAPLLEGLATVDRMVELPWGGSLGEVRVSASLLREVSADTVVLLANSFRSALVARLAGVRRRVGYARDMRSWLLTDAIKPPRQGGSFSPVPAVEYYLKLTGVVGCEPAETESPRLELATTADDEAVIDRMLAEGALPGGAFAVVHAGSQKVEKRWPAERFAAVADHLHERHGLATVLSGTPGEADVTRAVAAAARFPVTDLASSGLGLGPFKALIRRARVVVTNDTGPRHLGAALETPVVAVFGPTAPAWTLIPFDDERQVVSPAEDGAIDAATVESVTAATDDLLGNAEPVEGSAP